MTKKSLVFVIPAHQAYIWHGEDDYLEQNELLYSAISETYLPLLNMFSNLEADGIPFKVVMSFSPSLCSLLSDPMVQAGYLEWMDKVIALGERELEAASGDSSKKHVIEILLKQAKQNKLDFAETYQQDLLSKFSYFEKKGFIELMATAATNCYLPMYIDLPQSIQAQVEVGLISHRHFFNSAPEGFWLPYMGYAPNLDSIIRSYGFYYTILDSHGLLFGSPVPKNGIFTPVRSVGSSLTFFAADNAANAAFDDNPELYMHKPVYRNQNRDIGFEYDSNLLTGFLTKNNGRVSTGYKYWSQAQDEIYDFEKAKQQADCDAKLFVEMKTEKLKKASELIEDSDVSSVCCLNADFLGQKWGEGIYWLEKVIREVSVSEEIKLSTCSALAESKAPLARTSAFMSSDSDAGYAEEMIDHSNDWMIRYIRKAVDRMIDLTNRFPSDTGLKERALNLAAKEVLLAQSGDWPKMIKDKVFDDYSSERFRESVVAFTTVYDSLGSNSISTEWLTNMERKHRLFSWINYRVFSAKH